MKFFCLPLLLLAVCVLAEPNFHRNLTDHSIEIEISWMSKKILNPDAFYNTLLNMATSDSHVLSLEKINESLITKKRNPLNKTINTTKVMTYSVKTDKEYFKEAKISVRIQSIGLEQRAILRPKDKTEIIISITTPFQLYAEKSNFFIENFDISSIDTYLTASSNGKKWNVKLYFALKSQLLIRCLHAMRDYWHINKEPEVHGVLVFLKKHFENFLSKLYKQVTIH